MKPYLFSIIAAAAAIGMAQAQTAYTTPVGYYQFDGKAGGNLFVPCLVKPAAFTGVITAAGATTLTTSGLIANAFDDGAVYATHYVEITSGPNAGTTVDIVSNTATVITLASDISALSLAGTEGITVRPHVTLKSSLEGAEASLTPFSDVATFYAVDGSTASYIYGADSGTGWSSDFATADGDDRPIPPGTGVILGLAGNVALTVSGETKSGPTVVQLGLGFVNIVGPVNPLVGTTVPLNDTGLGGLEAFSDGITVYVPGPLDTSVSYVPLGDGTISSDFATPTTDTLVNTTGVVVIPTAGGSVKLNSGFTVAP
jgi:hypothetical protein